MIVLSSCMQLLHNPPQDRCTAGNEDVDMQIEGQQVELNHTQVC